MDRQDMIRLEELTYVTTCIIIIIIIIIIYCKLSFHSVAVVLTLATNKN
jgi:hypothetical protein